MIRVYFSDHDKHPGDRFLGLSFRETFLAPLEDMGSSCAVREMNDVWKATHAVMHYEVESSKKTRVSELDKFVSDWKGLSGDDAAGLIVLLVTYGGQELLRQRQHKQICRKKNGIDAYLYLLCAKDNSALNSENTIKRFYDMTAAQAESACRGGREFTSLPLELQRLFRPQVDASVLPALSILSQGYLALRANQYENSSGPVRDALAKMQWMSFRNSNARQEILKPEVTSGDEVLKKSTDLGNRETDYWRPLREGENEKVAAAEWRHFDGDRVVGNWDGCKTKDLLEVIGGKASEQEHATLVAEAFLELHKLLGGEKYV